jgi:hypothetical protein
MARARNIKPGFFTNDELAECDPLARILFIGLWTIADREGRLDDRPKKIKAELIPYDHADADKLLQQLAERKFITRYIVDDRRYIMINNFLRHQNPHKNEVPSTIPSPDETQGSLFGASAPVKAQTTPASSLNPLTESLKLIPDSPSPQPACADVREGGASETAVLDMDGTEVWPPADLLHWR